MKKTSACLIGLLFLIPFLPVSAQLTITEVFYDTPLYEKMRPKIGVDMEYIHHNGEFVELYNNSTLPVNLSGYSLKTLLVPAYTSFVFPENTICKPKDFIIVAFRHPNSPEFKLKDIFENISVENEKKILYHYSFVLGNKINTVILRNENSEIISYLGYRGGEAKSHHKIRLSVHRASYLSNMHFSNDFGRIIQTDANPFEKMDAGLFALKDALSDLQPSVADQSRSVGEIKTNISTTPSGAASVSIPLAFPAGISEFNPELSVSYNSQGGLGALGMRTELSGLSEIARVQENEYFDGKNSLVKFQEGGPYALDGTRLVRGKNNPNLYETSPIHSYTVIEATGNSGKGPLYFKVTSKDGIVTEYGSEASGRVYAKDGVNILSWKVSKVTNLNGNSITYTYTTNTQSGVYIKEIRYPGKTLNTIRFNYTENNYLPSSAYIDGTFFHSKLLLSGITVQAGNTSLEKYNFEYSNARLVRVSENGTNGEKLSLDMVWGGRPAKIIKNGAITLETKDNNVSIMTGDIDGDGNLEIIQKCSDDNYLGVYKLNDKSRYNTNPDIKIYGSSESRPSGSEPTHNAPATSDLKYIADVNSDGIDELIYFVKERTDGSKQSQAWSISALKYEKNNEFRSIRGGRGIVGNNAQLFLLNTDNDKYSDFLIISADGRYHLIPGKGGRKSGQIPMTGSYTLRQITTFDYNGDGYTELLFRVSDKWKIYDIRNDKFIDINLPIEKEFLYSPFIADVNNDGLQDIVLFSKNTSEKKGYITILENAGGTFIAQPQYRVGSFESPESPLGRINCVQADMNGDGLVDLNLVFNYTTEGGIPSKNIIYTLLKSPDGTFYADHYEWVDVNIGINFADMNRDGTLDILKQSKCLMDIISYPNATHNELSKIKCNGVEKVSFKYSPVANIHQPYIYNQSSASRCNLSSLKLVNQMNIPNGLGKMGDAYTNMSSTFKYSGGSYLNDGRGFLGFERSEENCISNGISTKTITETQFDKVSFCPVSQRVSKLINNKLVSSSRSQHTIKTMNTGDGCDPGKHIAVLLTEQNDTSFLDNSVVNKKISYDEYNRTLKQTVLYDDNSSVTTQYGGYSKYWQPLAVTETKKHFQDNSPFIQETKFDYDERSNLITKTEYSNTSSPVITYNEYYDNGLVKSKRTQAGGVESVTESYAYNLNLRNYKITRREDFSTTDSYYNLLTGNLEEQTVTYPGIATPQTTRYYYNGLGEKTRVVYPNRTEWRKVCRWATSNQAYLETTEHETGKPSVTKWYDVLGREIYSASKQGDVIMENAVIYNGVGQKLSEISCQPQKTSWTNYTYHPNGRIKNISTDIGKYIQYSYKNRTAYIEENGKNYIKSVDSWGNLLQQTDPDNTTVIHQYCSNGKPRRTTLGMHTITMTYDEKGNQLKLNDPNIGEISYTYDAYSRMKTYKDPKGGYTMAYDGYGRIKQKAYTSGRTTDYIYYNSGNGIGLPQSIQVNNGVAQSFTYDQYGNLLTKTEKIDNQLFTYNNVYDSWGRLIKHTGPNGYILNYTYDNSDSHVQTVTDQNNKMLWEYIKDIPHIESSYQIGNSLICTTTTSKDESQSTIQWNKSTGALLHENSYELDPLLGNITSRSEWYKTRRFTEKFEYDPMDRLIKVSGSTSMQMFYDNRGNITGKSNVGTYLYESGRTHAVTGINNPSDQLKSKPTQTIGYNEFNKIETIREGVYEMRFVYGPDEQRVKSELYKDNARIRTIYYGEGFDKQIDKDGNIRECSYLDTEGGGMFGMAVRESSTGTTAIYYFHTDILGSLIAVSNAYGMITEHHSYDAWGRRRNPTSWNNYTNVPAPNLTLRGYIFQEEMPEFGLINLNGRLYDPMLGRMLSPDPYVQNPENSQSYNRYSYCWNNPLKYTDPNGEFFLGGIIPGIGTLTDIACWGAVIGGATYTATVALSDGGFKNWDWKAFGKSAGLGALSAAITGGIGDAFGPVSSLGVGGEVLRAYTHGLAQAGVAVVSGSNPLSGFASGGLGSLAGSAFIMYGGSMGTSRIATYAFSGLAGGLGSKLSGGKFLDGMVIGLMNAGFNHLKAYIDERMRLPNYFQEYESEDCRYTVFQSFDDYYNGEAGILAELRAGYPKVSNNDEQLRDMYNSKGLAINDALEGISNVKSPSMAVEIGNNIAGNIKQGIGVSYEFKTSQGAHATGVTRIRVYNNGTIKLNLMNPARRGGRIITDFKDLRRLWKIQRIPKR